MEKWEEIGGNIDSGWGNNDFLWVIEGYSDTEAGVRLFRTAAQKCGRNTQVTRENKEANLKNRYLLVIGYSLILCIALFPYHGDSSGAILEVPSEALLHLSLVSRRSVGVLWQGIREVKEVEILIFVLFSEQRSAYSLEAMKKPPPSRGDGCLLHILRSIYSSIGFISCSGR